MPLLATTRRASRDLFEVVRELGRAVAQLDYHNLTANAQSASNLDAEQLRDEMAQALTQFGHDTCRPGQREVLESLHVEGKDTVFLAATGNGKSLSWMLPPSTRSWRSRGRVAVCFCGFWQIAVEQAARANELFGEGTAFALVGEGELMATGEELPDRPRHVDLERNMQHPATAACLAEQSRVRVLFLSFEMITGTSDVLPSQDVYNLLLALLRLGRLGIIAVDDVDMISLCGIEDNPRFVASIRRSTIWASCSAGWSWPPMTCACLGRTRFSDLQCSQ
jgi:hypothetical protein